MQDRFKFRAVLKTDKFTILVEPFYILNSCYFIDINKAEVEFKCKYPDECFWDFIEEIEKQDYIQEISIDGDLIITNDFTNLMQCTGSKDKNGKLIYEGDIVSVKFETQDFFGEDEYYWTTYKGKIIFEKGEIAIDVVDTTRHPISLYYNAKDCEVICNIYENPELLKDGE